LLRPIQGRWEKSTPSSQLGSTRPGRSRSTIFDIVDPRPDEGDMLPDRWYRHGGLILGIARTLQSMVTSGFDAADAHMRICHSDRSIHQWACRSLIPKIKPPCRYHLSTYLVGKYPPSSGPWVYDVENGGTRSPGLVDAS